MKLLTILFMAFMLIISSCATTSGNGANGGKGGAMAFNGDVSSEKPNVPVQASMLLGKWKLVSFEKDGEPVFIVIDTAPNVIGIEFDAPVDDFYPVKGFLGVNLFFDGKVTIENNRENREDNKNFIRKEFSLEGASTTLMTGPDGHKAFEANFKECLFTADKLSIKDENTLVIYNTEKKAELIFNRI